MKTWQNGLFCSIFDPVCMREKPKKIQTLEPSSFFLVIKDVCSEKSLKAPNYHDIRAHDESKLLMISLSKCAASNCLSSCSSSAKL